MTLLELAQKLRPLIEKAAISLSDADAIEAVTLFPNWNAEEESYQKDARVKYEGILYKCLQTHVPQAAWTPIAAPSLWEKVLIPDENTIPQWEQPDSTNAYMKGDKIIFNDLIYESLIDNNVWSPAAYPGGWKLV